MMKPPDARTVNPGQEVTYSGSTDSAVGRILDRLDRDECRFARRVLAVLASPDGKAAIRAAMRAPPVDVPRAAPARSSPQPLHGYDRDAFVERIEQEFDWPAVTASWTKHSTAESKAEDREQWLIDVAAQLYSEAEEAEPRPARRLVDKGPA